MRKLLLLGVLSCGMSVRAQALDPKDVPAPLRPWVDWSLRGYEEARCPRLSRGDSPTPECSWPSRLELDVVPTGAVFRLQGWRFAPGFLMLPGSDRLWPLEVQVGGRLAPVVQQGGHPAVEVRAGEVRVTGRFSWDTPPASVLLPVGMALVRLTVDAAVVARPELDAAGQLFLRRATSAPTAERLDIQVQRKLTDGVPLRLETRLVLEIAGKAREVLLGRVLPEGFEPLALDAPLPARLEPDGRLRLQIRPGRWVVSVTGRRAALTTAVARPVPGGPWTPGEEIWVFEADPALRVVTVEGLTGVDPSQTDLPEPWRALPAYAVRPGETMRFEVRRRGDADPEPDQVQLRRDLWLDFDGAGWTLEDKVAGTLSRTWRLQMPGPLQLGRVSVGNVDQPITRLSAQTPPGVEVREGKLDLTADSRLDGATGTLPAVGWDEDVTSLAATLHLPPGWRVLAARGVDEVPGTWFRQWSLLDLFLVLVLALAAARLYGRGVGALALLTLALSFPEADAPQWSWVAVLGAEALVRFLPEGRMKKVLHVLRLGAFAVLALLLVQFAVAHLRAAIYPALGGPEGSEVSVVASKPAAPPPASASVGAEVLVEGKADGTVGRKVETPGVAPGQEPATPSVPENSYLVDTPMPEMDRRAVVQTGPGIPRWRWTQLPLRWNGPVQRGQTLHLFLLSPGMARLLAFLRVLLLALLALKLFEGVTRLLPRLGKPGAAALLVAALLLPRPASAEDQPSDQRLAELRNRLLAAPRCAPNCVAVTRLLLELDPQHLRLRMEVSADAPATLPLPGSADQWLPAQVMVDGQPARALRREKGRLVLAVLPGVHQVLLEGPLPAVDAVQLALGMVPGHARAVAAGWKVDGIHEDGRADATLQLTRIELAGAAPGGAELRSSAMPPFVSVVRVLHLGLTWTVDTSVVRISAPGSAAVLEVPVLAGESVTTADVRVAGGRVLVNLPPQAERIAWHGTLEPRDVIALTAPADGTWVEQWTLEAGTMWHVVLGGIPALYPTQPAEVHRPTWRPWPGESVKIQVSRPEGAGGQTLTVDATRLAVAPGLRATDATLTLVLRSSRGTQHAVVLPPGAELLGVTIGGVSQPIRSEAGKVLLSLSPGTSAVGVRWREPRGLGLFFRPGSVDVGAPTVNASTEVRLPPDRWVLLVGGPVLGPAVLFWSLLLVTVLVAVALGRTTLVPLGTVSWVLLGLGLTQVPIWAGAVVVACLLAFGWRARRGAAVASARNFDALQILLAGLTLLSLVVLFAAIRQGLLGAPEMQVLGNNSTASELRWFQDRTAGPLPQPWVLSVPLLVYRLTMLAWALWLATALLSWFRWGAAAATAGGLWRPLSRRQPTPAPPAPPPAG